MRVALRRRGLQRVRLGAAERAQRAPPRPRAALRAAPPRARLRAALARRGARRAARHAECGVWTYLVHFWNMRKRCWRLSDNL